MTNNRSPSNAVDGGGDGGGLSAWIQAESGAGQGLGGETEIDHTVTVDNNLITGNVAENRGGGLDMFMFADQITQPDVVLSLNATDNVMSDNDADESVDFGGGGGALVQIISAETAPSAAQGGRLEVEFTGNTLLFNDSVDAGGGLSLVLSADGDVLSDATVSPNPATIDVNVERNLIANNRLLDTSTTTFDPSGTGIFVELEAFGPGVTNLEIDRATIANNSVETGGSQDAGGLHIEAWTDIDRLGIDDGQVTLVLTNSILTGNGSFEIGGAEPGIDEGFLAPFNGQPIGGGSEAFQNSGNLTRSFDHNDIFAPGALELEAWVSVDDIFNSGNGNVNTDPMLTTTGNAFTPDICSDAVDGGDPALDASSEPRPNGDRINMGFLGGTSGAVASLPDLGGEAGLVADGTVDGKEILLISAAFGGRNGQDPWYLTTADVDGNNVVDGNDLAIIAGLFGQTCAP